MKVAVHDNLYLSCIIVGEQSERAKVFVDLLVEGVGKANIDVLFTESTETEGVKSLSNIYLHCVWLFSSQIIEG